MKEEKANRIVDTVIEMTTLAVFLSVTIITVAAATTILVEGTKSTAKVAKNLLTRK